MIRRILLIAFLAGTPVAEARAAFLLTDLATAETATASAGRSSGPVRRDAPRPDRDSDPQGGVHNQPDAMSSQGPSLVTVTPAGGAVLAPAARIAEGGRVAYFLSEGRHGYQEPMPPGMFRPPRNRC